MTCQTMLDALFVNIFIETAISIHLPNVCGCFHTTMAELDSCDRPYGPQWLMAFSTWPFKKNFANSCSIG